MSEREAIKVLSPLREACRSTDMEEQIKAQNLLEEKQVVSSALGVEFRKALGVLRAIFDQIDRWEERNLHPDQEISGG